MTWAVEAQWDEDRKLFLETVEREDECRLFVDEKERREKDGNDWFIELAKWLTGSQEDEHVDEVDENRWSEFESNDILECNVYGEWCDEDASKVDQLRSEATISG